MKGIQAHVAMSWWELNSDLRPKVGGEWEAAKVQATLLKSHPELLDLAKVTMGDKSVQVTQNRLCHLSDKFRIQLGYVYRASSKDEIILDGQGVEPAIIEAFLDYLVTGEIAIDHDNVLPLVCLAHRQCLTDLFRKCCDFVHEALNDGRSEMRTRHKSFQAVLPCAIETQIPELLCMCYAFISKHDDPWLMRAKRTPALKKGVTEIKAHLSSGVSFTYEKGRLWVVIKNVDNMSKKGFEALKTLYITFGVVGLEIHKACKTTSYEKLKFIQTPRYLRLGKVDEYGSNSIAIIPQRWLDSAESISLIQYRTPKVLDCKRATYVHLYECRELEGLVAPQAKQVVYAISAYDVVYRNDRRIKVPVIKKLNSVIVAQGCVLNGLPREFKVKI